MVGVGLDGAGLDGEGLGTLAVLALVDSLSFGTLLIPVWLLMAPGRVRPGRVLTFLAAVVLTYLLLGLALLLGASALVGTIGDLRGSDAFLGAQLVAGLGLLGVSQLMDGKTARARAAERSARGEGRLPRWRARAMGDDGARASVAGLVALAVTAVLAEVATMLPYLAAIGIITAQGPGLPGDALLLAGYCAVMVLPALALTVGRLLARDLLAGPLGALDRWLTRHARSTTAWIIGIVGVVLALRAVSELGLIGG